MARDVACAKCDDTGAIWHVAGIIGGYAPPCDCDAAKNLQSLPSVALHLVIGLTILAAMLIVIS